MASPDNYSSQINFSSSQEEKRFFEILKKFSQKKAKTRDKEEKKKRKKEKKEKKLLKINNPILSNEKILSIIKFARKHLPEAYASEDSASLPIQKSEELHLITTSTRDTIKLLFAGAKNLYDQTKNPGHLNTMALLLNGLFLQSKQQNDLNENKKLGRSLFLQFHPDKTNNPEEIEFSTKITASLLDNEVSEYLKTTLQNINEDTIRYIVGKPTKPERSLHHFLKKASLIVSEFILPTLSYHVSYQVVNHLLPNKTLEKTLINKCTNNIQHTSLYLEKLSLDIKAKQLRQHNY